MAEFTTELGKRIIDPLEQAAADACISYETLMELLKRDQQMSESQAAAKRPRVDGSSSTQPGPLLPGWVEANDPRYGNTTYWYHRDTNETTWTRPAGPPPVPSGGYGPRGTPQISYRPVGDYGPAGYGPAANPGVTGMTLFKLLPGVILDDAMQAMLEAWVKAKREKDYERADLIRHDIRAAGYDPDSWWPTDAGPPGPQAGYGAGLPQPPADEMGLMAVPAMPDGFLRVNMSAGGPVHGGYVVHGGDEPPVSSTHMALQAWVEAKRMRDFDEADRIREAMLAQGVDPSKILPKWGRWSSRERQLREIAENKRLT